MHARTQANKHIVIPIWPERWTKKNRAVKCLNNSVKWSEVACILSLHCDEITQVFRQWMPLTSKEPLRIFTNFNRIVWFFSRLVSIFFHFSCSFHREYVCWFHVCVCMNVSYTAFSFRSGHTNNISNRCKGSNSVKVNTTVAYIQELWNKHTDGKRENKQTLVVVSFGLQLQPASMRMHTLCTMKPPWLCTFQWTKNQPNDICSSIWVFCEQ